VEAHSDIIPPVTGESIRAWCQFVTNDKEPAEYARRPTADHD